MKHSSNYMEPQATAAAPPSNSSPADHPLATLFVVIITSFITTFTSSALNLSVPAMGSEFHVSAELIGWIVTGYTLACAALSVPFGRIADLTERKRILVIGIFLFSLCAGAATFSPTIEILLLFRVLQGAGAAMIFSTNIAVLLAAFAPEKRGKILGYSIASTYIGLSAGPVIGGMLNHTLGWRSIFMLTFLIGIITFFLALLKLPRSYGEGKQEKMDTIGSLLYVAMIIAIMYGFSSFSSVWAAKYLILLGILLFVFFLIWEQKVKSPVIQIRLFAHNMSYSLSNLAALLNYGATFALGYLLSIYLQMVMGFNSQISGIILISQPLLMAILSPYAGRLSDRVSPFKLASLGMALCAVGLFSLIFLTDHSPLGHILLALIVIGVGFAFFSSPNTNAIMACVEAKDYGVASSILATMRTIGQTSSMAIVTFIVAKELGTTPLANATPNELIATAKITFAVFTVLCIAGIFFSLKRNGSAPCDEPS